jgi:hypothetical protein
MNWRAALKNWVCGHRHRVIWGNCPERLGPLMTRYYLLGESRKICLYAHCFHRSDDDRFVHDHPWSFLTFPLVGYWEHLPDGTKQWIRPYRFYYRPAEWQHWVETVERETWTVLIKFRTRRVWGFITESGWRKWDTVPYKGCD